MGISDRYNRLIAAMAILEEDGLNPVLAVRRDGHIYEFRIHLVTRHLSCESTSEHPRAIIEDPFAEFVEGYPGYRVNQALGDIW